MPGLVQARSKSRSLLVILPCGALAFALPLLFREGALKPAAPAIFLLVIILGRFAVCNAADRVVLLLIRRVRPRRGLPFQDPGKLNRHEPLTHAMLSLPKKRLACGGRIQALPLRDAFPIAHRPPSKPTASTHPG